MKITKITLLIIVSIIILSLLLSLPTMLLWNWLLTDIFDLQSINIFQSFGLNILSGILLKNINIHYNKNDNKNQI